MNAQVGLFRAPCVAVELPDASKCNGAVKFNAYVANASGQVARTNTEFRRKRANGPDH